MIIQFTENNILTPNIVGYNVKLSPLMIILGLVAAGMVWGIPGMLVIIPFLAMLNGNQQLGKASSLCLYFRHQRDPAPRDKP
ncbi:MAG: AI-2E family transporter [Bacteroidales bacterium]|nr:AI-2E family transporter [Bacteroidales bacterium]